MYNGPVIWGLCSHPNFTDERVEARGGVGYPSRIHRPVGLQGSIPQDLPTIRGQIY